MKTIKQIQLETENWQLKGQMLNMQQALMQYQAKEVAENLKRLDAEEKAMQAEIECSSANSTHVASPA